MKIKKCRFECLMEPVFVLTKTKFLKKRLRELQKKPKKNECGIERIQAELDRRKLEELNLDRMLDEIDREFAGIDDYSLDDSCEDYICEDDYEEEQTRKKLDLSEEEYGEALEMVGEMKGSIARRINEDSSFIEKLQINSNKLKVIAEIRYENDEIYGYEIHNISRESVVIKYSETNMDIMHPGEIRTIELEKFIRMACQPEISFTFSNGSVKGTKSLIEDWKQEKETGIESILRNYHVVPKKDSEPIPVIYIE